MIEGLWIVRFALPDEIESELTGGVAVIETDRLLGGDSGYYYVGDVAANGSGSWTTKLKIVRHDPTIISLFGDLDSFELSGNFAGNGNDEHGRPMLIATFPMRVGPDLVVELTKVSELP